MSRDQINVRCDKEMKRYLEDLDMDYSKYIRDLIDKDRIEKCDPSFIDSKISGLEKEIEKLQNLKKTRNISEDKIHELLAYHAPAFKQNAPVRSNSQRITFIEKMIIPDLRKYGSKTTAQELDDILLNWPEGN